MVILSNRDNFDQNIYVPSCLVSRSKCYLTEAIRLGHIQTAPHWPELFCCSVFLQFIHVQNANHNMLTVRRPTWNLLGTLAAWSKKTFFLLVLLCSSLLSCVMLSLCIIDGLCVVSLYIKIVSHLELKTHLCSSRCLGGSFRLFVLFLLPSNHFFVGACSFALTSKLKVRCFVLGFHLFVSNFLLLR